MNITELRKALATGIDPSTNKALTPERRAELQKEVDNAALQKGLSGASAAKPKGKGTDVANLLSGERKVAEVFDGLKPPASDKSNACLEGGISSFKSGDIKYTIDSISEKSIQYDMEIATKSGSTVHIPETITKDKINLGLPEGKFGAGDLGLTIDEVETKSGTVHGNLLIQTKSGSELKFPYTMENAERPAIKLDSVDLTKVTKNKDDK